MLNYKRTLWVALAVVFIVVLFFVKNKTTFKNIVDSALGRQENGLVYNTETLEDLVNKDTDGDTILDWEEKLWGTDPAKKETTLGTSDKVAIEKLKDEQANNSEKGEGSDSASLNTENLTKTDQFSRELFTMVAAASQNGDMDAATIETLSASLAAKIGNPEARKVFLNSDIKISTKDDKATIQSYADALINIQKIYTVDYTVLDVLQKFSADEENIDASILLKLGPIIEQTNKVIDAALKTNAPKSLSVLHLNVLNSLQRLSENLSDIKLYDTDPIVSLGAIIKYNENAAALESDMMSLENGITQKLNN